MKLLLDTHVLLWWLVDDQRLPRSVQDVIADTKNDIYVSAASGWEIAIKYSLGNINLPAHPDRYISEQIAENNFSVLPITMRHALNVYKLPPHHRDPFDRILISQSQVEDITIVSGDELFKEYKVKVYWKK